MAIPKLGVNIDHVATLRQLRSTPYPKLVPLAQEIISYGVSQITVHLREDRRHIQDQDVADLKAAKVPLNLEMALSAAILKIALKTKPEWVCIVPEKRQELTTEGGLNLKGQTGKLAAMISKLKSQSIKVSLFVEPNIKSVKTAKTLGADALEFHTGRFCLETQKRKQDSSKIKSELASIESAALLCRDLGLGVHAGHGIDYQNIRMLSGLNDSAKLPLIREYNIGHSIVCRAVEVGMRRAVLEMISAIQAP